MWYIGWVAKGFRVFIVGSWYVSAHERRLMLDVSSTASGQPSQRHPGFTINGVSAFESEELHTGYTTSYTHYFGFPVVAVRHIVVSALSCHELIAVPT